jgi:hypothetical protein
MPAADIVLGGTAQWEDSGGNTHPYPGAKAKLYFQDNGKGAWQDMAAAVTGKSGDFAFPRLSGYLGDGRLATGNWQAIVPGGGVYVAGQTGATPETLGVPVFFGGVRVTRAGSTRYLSGTLRYLQRGGALHGVRVILLTSVNGRLQRGPTTTTNASGAFRLRLTPPKTGQRVKYAASFAGLVGGAVPAWIGAVGYFVLEPGRSAWLPWS